MVILTSFSVLTVIPLVLFVFPETTPYNVGSVLRRLFSTAEAIQYINIKLFRKISQFERASAFFLVIFGKLLRACFIIPGPAKLRIVRVRSVLNDVSVPLASCLPNRRHSEYYSCQTGILCRVQDFTYADELT